MNDAESQPVAIEEPCVAVRVELQSPVTTYRAPLPYVPVVVQARGYQRATVVDALPKAPQPGSEAVPVAESEIGSIRDDEHTKRHKRSESQNGQLFQGLQRSRSSDVLRGGGMPKKSATLGPWRSWASDVDGSRERRRRDHLEEIVKRSNEGTSHGLDTELFIREKGDPELPGARELNKKNVPLDYAVNGGIPVGRTNSKDLGRSEESQSVPDQNGTRRTSGQSQQELTDRRIRNGWILPLDQDFSWNKPVNSVHKMISNYEKAAREKNTALMDVNTMPGTRHRLTRAPRVPVTTLARRFKDGAKE